MTNRRTIWAVALVLALGPGGAWAQSGDAPEADESAARARAVLERATSTLESARSLRARARVSYDVVQESGQHLEFGATRYVSLRRPDRLRIDAERRDGEKTRFYFDGSRGTLQHPDHGIYSQMAMGPTVDAAFDALEREIGVPTPMADLLRSDLAAQLDAGVRDLLWVGTASLEGLRCEHIAFTIRDVDVQLWVRVGEPALIQRLVLTYVEEEGAPQFRADLLDWELGVELADALFHFEPPEGAEQVPFVAIGGPPPAPAEESR